jgi:4-diphosphocytidyl-2-C-methyl-D-erythritol kinase
MKITAKSFAKINLFLEITGKNSKNYHLINSLMAFIDIFDVIEVEKLDDNFPDITPTKIEDFDSPLGGIILEVLGERDLEFLGKKEDNILVKTANLMAKKFNFTPNIKIKLEKNIPIAAGLGGGSSNAATLIHILNKLYDLQISQQKLQEFALEIGADVPFCLYQKMALVQGIGEKIIDIEIEQPELFLLIINPKMAINTAQIFQNLELSEKNIPNNDQNDIINMIKYRQNHLQIVAEKFCPEITDIFANLRLQRNIINAKLSGSGATCFAIFNKKEDLDLAFENLKDIFPDFYIKKSKLLYKISSYF